MQQCSSRKPTHNPGMMALESIIKMLPPGAFVDAETRNIMMRDADGNPIVLATPEHEVWQSARASAHEAIRIHERLSTAPAKPNPPAECKTEDSAAYRAPSGDWLADAIRRLHGEE